jgi:hypothetical protein
VHGWDQLSPFANIARMIDLLDLFIRVMLVGIVLIAVMNVMMMAVYERIREIGMIAAIGTPPRRILALFLAEGCCSGVAGTAIGVAAEPRASSTRSTSGRCTSGAFGREQRARAAPAGRSPAPTSSPSAPSSSSWRSSPACSRRGRPRAWIPSRRCIRHV